MYRRSQNYPWKKPVVESQDDGCLFLCAGQNEAENRNFNIPANLPFIPALKKSILF